MMTVFAFEFFYFVKNKNNSVFRCCLVAFSAGYIFVLPVQREKRFIVVKLCCRPECQWIMTPAAVGKAVTIKLFRVNILVAISTVC